jgi:hypothetical protein
VAAREKIISAALVPEPMLQVLDISSYLKSAGARLRRLPPCNLLLVLNKTGKSWPVEYFNTSKTGAFGVLERPELKPNQLEQALKA